MLSTSSPERATGQAGVKYIEFPLAHLVFARGIKGIQGSDHAVGASQTTNAHSSPGPPPGGTAKAVP